MVYATYDFYTDVYFGNAIPSADFNRLINRASIYIDGITQGRATSYSADDAVKMAACAIAETWLKNEQGGELQSQSVGSWSRTYSTKAKSSDERLYDAAKLYLGPIGLLSRWI